MNEEKIVPQDDMLVQTAFTITAIVALLIVRVSLFYYVSFDYYHSLSNWTYQFRQMTFIEAMGANVGNYNPMYMYILNIIARINFPDMYLIKVVSVIFDVVLAYFAMKIVSLKTSSVNMHILTFLLVFSIPTVILNGAMWGQCDSIYSAFVLGALYFALKGRSKLAFAFIGLALAFKLQVAFMFPMFAVFIFTGKIKFRDCYVFVLVYIATLLPAIIAGRPIGETLMVYLNQPNTYLHLNMNAVNIWQFVVNVEFMPVRTAGLFMAGVAVLGLLYFTYVYRHKLTEKKMPEIKLPWNKLVENSLTVDKVAENKLAENELTKNRNFIRLSYLFAVMVPFLLPQMHDRFFFMAEALSVVVFLYDKRRWYVPVVTIFCSFLAYARLIMESVVLLDFRLAALALMTVIFIVLKDYVTSLVEGE